MLLARDNVQDLVTEIAGASLDSGDMSSTEHGYATSAAQSYLQNPRDHWPVRDDDRNSDNVLLKVAWAKHRPCSFDVVVKDDDGDLQYVRSSSRDLMKPGHGVMFTASLSAFIPLGQAEGPKFSIFYTVRGMTLLRRATVAPTIKIDSLVEGSDASDLDLSQV